MSGSSVLRHREVFNHILLTISSLTENRKPKSIVFMMNQTETPLRFDESLLAAPEKAESSSLSAPVIRPAKNPVALLHDARRHDDSHALSWRKSSGMKKGRNPPSLGS